MLLTDIIIYPVKSLAGIPLKESIVEPMGLFNDRKMMLVDEDGVFVSQRKYPKMTLLKTLIERSEVTVFTEGLADLKIDFFNQSPIEVEVWKTKCVGFVANDNINQWFSHFLEAPLRLVKYDLDQPRNVIAEFSSPGDIVSFADEFPLLVISQASLKDLNLKLEKPVTMNRFRPNIVVDGFEAYAEDNWKKVRIGEVEFDAVKRCSRCVLTTVDPESGIKDPNGEPLRTLSRYRKTPEGVKFGMNLIPRNKGVIRTGDKIEILS